MRPRKNVKRKRKKCSAWQLAMKGYFLFLRWLDVRRWTLDRVVYYEG